ncbi:chitin deacetylase [Gryganskiella cystojenkinii]|nr:chitin deacetylase [Gryganskiella cystojenkinii]
MQTSRIYHSRKRFLFTTAVAFFSATVALLSSSVEAAALIKAGVAYPPGSEVPPTDSAEVQQWLSEIDLTGAPSIELNSGDPPNCPDTVLEDVCYWTCEDCANDDIVTCPDKDVWGLTFDDGPTSATPDLLQFLDQQNVKATFFLIGSNVVQYPELVMQEVQAGHHLASHTWSHHALTTLSNEQIVAEIKWTEKAIEDATGYRVRYMRPPYGDVDNRVRFVLRKLGYTVVDWTGDTFDSNDWKIPGMSMDQVASKFKGVLEAYTSASANNSQGFISLEHDLNEQTVGVAKEMIPFGLSKNLNIMTVAQCLHDTSPYASVNGAITGPQDPIIDDAPVNDAAVSSSIMGSTAKGSLDLASKSNAAAHSQKSLQEQHFLGRFMPGSLFFSTSSLSRDIHSATKTVTIQFIQKAVWSGLVLGSFVVGLASL